MPPRIERVEPRHQMKVEVVPAGVAARQLRLHGYSGGEQDNGWANQAVPWFTGRC
jgi:hypothetical protein